MRARVAAVESAIDLERLAPRPAAPGLALNDIGQVSLALAQPVLADTYAENRVTGAFVLIDPASLRTVGAGMVL